MQDFIEIKCNSDEEIIYNAMVLFRHGDLGAKIDTSMSREIKKESESQREDLPLQLRLRLHNRFNMDLNNVYAMEFRERGEGFTVETSVNVYHDDFDQETFDSMVRDIMDVVLRPVTFGFLMRRFHYNYRNTLNHWRAAKEKQFIRDPQVDRLKVMHDAFAQFLCLMKGQAEGLDDTPAREFLEFKTDIELVERKIAYSRSKILKVDHHVSKNGVEKLRGCPQFFSAVLLEYCLVPLFLVNEKYIMSLIYKRDPREICAVLKKHVQEI